MRRPTRSSLLVLAGLALALTACQPKLTRPPGAGPLRYRDAVFSAVTTTTGITFGSAKDQRGVTQTLKLDLYEPTGDTVTARPAIVWVHGGSFKTGSRTSPELVDEATTFAKHGYVNVSIDYRLSTGGCTPVSSSCLQGITDAKHDAQAAVRFLRAHAATYGVDPTRIAVGGTSAGAITALNVAYGADDVGTSGSAGQSSEVAAAVSLSGASLLDAPSAGEPPALLFHGDADPLVPYAWATRTVDLANAAHLVVGLITFAGAGHVPYQYRQKILDNTNNFLYWTMDLAHAAR